MDSTKRPLIGFPDAELICLALLLARGQIMLALQNPPPDFTGTATAWFEEHVVFELARRGREPGPYFSDLLQRAGTALGQGVAGPGITTDVTVLRMPPLSEN